VYRRSLSSSLER